MKLFREFQSPRIQNHQRVHNSIDISVLRYEVFHVGVKEVKVGNTIRRVAGWLDKRQKKRRLVVIIFISDSSLG